MSDRGRFVLNQIDSLIEEISDMLCGLEDARNVLKLVIELKDLNARSNEVKEMVKEFLKKK